MKILICGSREWEDAHSIYVVLQGAKAVAESNGEILEVVHGDCPTGADAVAEELCGLIGIHTYPTPARWNTEGKAAGPNRNQRMLDTYDVEVVYGFRLPGRSPGTDDMTRRSKESGIPTYVMRQA